GEGAVQRKEFREDGFEGGIGFHKIIFATDCAELHEFVLFDNTIPDRDKSNNGVNGRKVQTKKYQEDKYARNHIALCESCKYESIPLSNNIANQE
ncbi:MAG TPA: hypothetical protein PLF42_11790, partial [Anaerolineales bacterium]|nr:hypothetical protein [Anaerolineales bacterium]